MAAKAKTTTVRLISVTTAAIVLSFIGLILSIAYDLTLLAALCSPVLLVSSVGLYFESDKTIIFPEK